MIFLSETKLECSCLEIARRRLGFMGCLGMNPVGRKGGLTFLWRNQSGMEIYKFSQNHISTWVEDSSLGVKWMLARFYGEPNTSRRHRTWDLLKCIKPQSLIPWWVIRDFNKILYHLEKEGGQQRNKNLMCNFRETLEECELIDLGCEGDPFTWSNKHETVTFTKERLDRVVAIRYWFRIYNEVKVKNLVSRTSNHKPLVAYCDFLGADTVKKRKLFSYKHVGI